MILAPGRTFISLCALLGESGNSSVIIFLIMRIVTGFKAAALKGSDAAACYCY